LIDDELRVMADVKLLNPKLDGDALAIDECLIFNHIVGRSVVQPNHIEESVSLEGDQHYTSPGPVESVGAIAVHAPLLLGHQGGGC
jgi:hypothetical protein